MSREKYLLSVIKKRDEDIRLLENKITEILKERDMWRERASDQLFQIVRVDH